MPAQSITARQLFDEFANTVWPALTVAEGRAVAETIRDAISEALVSGNRVEIRGFGSWSPRLRKAGNMHNPRTLEKVIAEDRYKVAFRAGKYLAQVVDESRPR